MNVVAIADFKAKCTAYIRRVAAKNQPIIVTVRGEPQVEVRPVESKRPRQVRIGGGARTGTIHGDIVSEDGSEWTLDDDVLGRR